MCHHLINVFSEDASLFSFVNRLECVCVPQPLACRPEDPAGAETGVCALGGGVLPSWWPSTYCSKDQGGQPFPPHSLCLFPGRCPPGGVCSCWVVGSQALAASQGCRCAVLGARGSSSLSREIKEGCGTPHRDSPQPYVSFQM